MKIEEIIIKVLSTPNSAFFYTPPVYKNSNSYLFLKPKKIVNIDSLKNLESKLHLIDEYLEKGLVGYCLLKYEAGYLFEKRLNRLISGKNDLIQYCFYNENEISEIDSSLIELNNSNDYSIKNFYFNSLKNEFESAINKIKNFIQEGDTYQVNYTIKGKFNFAGSFSSLFSKLVFNQSAKYSAFINSGNNIIISLSPELFFEQVGSTIISKPMKGTIKRDLIPFNDVIFKDQLLQSKKNRAENVMIVDLIRNDLGRISRYGSVKVKKLFDVEKYESLFQMVSTIQSTLKNKVKHSDVIKNIFPCGSITGAPKIRTMEIIREVEKEERGIYTGSIGLILKNKKIFNVAIRTLIINKKNNSGEIGLGSGVVWDSNSSEEYEETKLKGKFLTNSKHSFEIFETMKYEKGKIFLLSHHLERLRKAADHFLFHYNSGLIRSELKRIIRSLDSETKIIRLSLNKQGNVKIEIKPFIKFEGRIKIAISRNNIYSKNPFQYFKTTNRELYEKEYKIYSAKGFFDVIYFNQFGELVEGAITNIFIQKKNILLTPPVNSGLLDGVYRKYLLKKFPNIIERKLSLKDLINADEIFLTNSVRGKITVNEIHFAGKKLKSFN